MSEEYSAEYEEFNDDDTQFESHLSDADAEYEEVDEEISTDEVDRVLETLTNLLESVESSTVHEYLEEAYSHIFSLVYEEDSGEEDSGEEDSGEEDSGEEDSGEEDSGEEDELETEDLEGETYEEDFGDEEMLDDEAAQGEAA